MALPTPNHLFKADHIGPESVDDPNLFLLSEIQQAIGVTSTTVSLTTSTAVSTVSAAAPDSTNLSIADSKGVSSGVRASVADSKSISNSANVSVVDSKTGSGSVNTSIADSKAVSIAAATPTLTVIAASQSVSTADSKAVSIAVGVPAVSRTVTNVGTFLGNNAVFNVKDYGATGNGTTDDTVAIQNCINAAAANPVRVPAGTYVVTASLTYSTAVAAQGLRLLGDGMYQTIFDNRVASAPMIDVDGNTNTTFQFNGLMADFAIITTTSPASSDGIRLRSSWLGTVARVRVVGLTGDGIVVRAAIGDADSTSNLHIQHCHITRCTGWGINAIITATSTVFVFMDIEHNYIALNTLGGIRATSILGAIRKNSIAQNLGSGGILIYTSSGNSFAQLVIEDNEFESNAAAHITAPLGNGLLVQRNQFNAAVIGAQPFQPAVSVLVGDGSSGVTTPIIVHNRVRLTPAGSVHTFLRLLSDVSYAQVENNIFTALSAPAIRYDDRGTQTRILDDALLLYQSEKVYNNGGTATSYTPAFSNGMVHRMGVTTTGTFTLNNPSTSNEAAQTWTPGQAGRTIEFIVINASGGGITIAYGTQYAGETPTIANGKTRTARFCYDSTSAVFRQVGAWSGDV